MSNYKCAASQITNFWSMKTAYEFLDLGSELTDDHLVYSSEMKFFDSSRVRPDPLCPTMTSLYDYDISRSGSRSTPSASSVASSGGRSRCAATTG